MALFHLSVTQTKRSAGQSAIASAAYRAGERLYSEYYGEYSDYTRKGGVICSDILLPSHAPPEYADRQTLWNAVEKAERGKNAQLAYSFDIALQNEFSLEENIALARQFLLENFVSRGMVVDFAVHQPDREDGGIPNPHFHVLCPIRPIEQNGKWGLKQRRVYELDEDGNRIRDADGNFVFNAVPTTDWGSPETLEYWRQTWAELCNAKFAEKGLDVRIDHRSYERQGVELLPTVHEGATVRAMEKKGIRTEKGEFNRWIKATNAVIRDIKKKIALLFDWIAEAKAELAKPQAPDLVSLLNAYYTQRRAGAYSQKGKVSNLKEMNETFNYLRANGIYSLEDGRMIEIYLLTSLAPIPFATVPNRETGHMGQNYFRSLFAVGFQGLLILVCVAIYAVLIQSIATDGDPIGAIWGCVGYTVLLCFTLFKTGSLAKSIFGCH